MYQPKEIATLTLALLIASTLGMVGPLAPRAVAMVNKVATTRSTLMPNMAVMLVLKEKSVFATPRLVLWTAKCLNGVAMARAPSHVALARRPKFVPL